MTKILQVGSGRVKSEPYTTYHLLINLQSPRTNVYYDPCNLYFVSFHVDSLYVSSGIGRTGFVTNKPRILVA